MGSQNKFSFEGGTFECWYSFLAADGLIILEAGTYILFVDMFPHYSYEFVASISPCFIFWGFL
jgi:hypothetical protein